MSTSFHGKRLTREWAAADRCPYRSAPVRVTRVTRVVEPDPRAHAAYARHYGRYRALYPVLGPLTA